MAVPSSGAISLTGLAGEKLNDDYGDQDFDDVISLTDLVLGGNTNGSHESWEATNANSTSKPDTSAPHAMSEWYGYDHDAAAAFANAKAVSKALETGVNHNINLLDTDDTFNFTGSSAWTISFWVKAGWSSSLNTNIHFFIGQKENAPYQLTDMIKIMYNESNNRLRAHYGNKTTSSNGWSKYGEWLFHANSGQYAAGYAAAGLGSSYWSASNRGYVNSDNYTMITFTKSTIVRNLKKNLGNKKYEELINKKKSNRNYTNSKEKISSLEDKDNLNKNFNNDNPSQDLALLNSFIEIAPLDYEIENSPQKDLSSLPISDISFPKVVFMIVDKKIELETKYLKDYPNWQFLSNDELERKTIEIFEDLKNAKRSCNKEQRVIKVPNTEVFKIVSPFLLSRGISRIVSDDKLIAL